MLEAESLHKSYAGQPAIDDLNLCVGKGEIYALLGPNGAGKTTTINCFLGFVRPDKGRVLVNGNDPALDDRRVRRSLAYIPEQISLYGWFTGVENLSYFTELAGERLSRQRCESLLIESGLEPDALNKRVSGYSKGMTQKVGIAIALAKEAQALLLDEPTSGLDPSAAYEFSRSLRALRDRGVAILLATHDLFRAKEDASRIGIMRHGRLVHELAGTKLGHAELEDLYLEAIRD